MSEQVQLSYDDTILLKDYLFRFNETRRPLCMSNRNLNNTTDQSHSASVRQVLRVLRHGKVNSNTGLVILPNRPYGKQDRKLNVHLYLAYQYSHIYYHSRNILYARVENRVKILLVNNHITLTGRMVSRK